MGYICFYPTAQKEGIVFTRISATGIVYSFKSFHAATRSVCPVVNYCDFSS